MTTFRLLGSAFSASSSLLAAHPAILKDILELTTGMILVHSIMASKDFALCL
jgi:hypothetical protein